MLAKGKVVAAICIILVGQVALAGWESDRVERDLKTQPGETLRLKNINGNVEATGWDNPHIELVAVKQAKGGLGQTAQAKLSRMEISVERSGNGWEVRTQIDRDSMRSRRMNNTRVSYELKVPHGLVLELETTNGSVQVESFDGDLRLETTNGNIVAKTIRGNLEAETTNGSIRVELLEYAGDELNCRTTNGNVTLAVPADVQADLSARTTNGSIKTDIPMKISGSMSRRKVEGTLNGGGSRIVLRTVNGSIRISEI